jgi:hypothetical protein
MQKRVAWAVSAALVGALIGGYYAWRWIGHRDAVVAPAVPPRAESATPAPAKPAIQHPIEHAGPTAVAKMPLPALDASDGEFQDAIARLIGRVGFLDLVRPESVIRHIVVTVDNLPRKTLAARLSPVKPVPGAFVSSDAGANPTLAAVNVSRYTPYVTALDAVDAGKLVAVYAYFYPLFQQAYQELGYPNGYFNDRLVEAIDVMLASPELSGPIALAQPRVLYQFADPDLEALPSGQKIMLRIGPENAARVKAKLAAIRRALTGHGANAIAPAAAARHAPAVSAPSAPAPSSTTASGG